MDQQKVDDVLRERGLTTEDIKRLLLEGLRVRHEMHEKYKHLRTPMAEDLRLVLD